MVVNELKLNKFHYISNMERQTESMSFRLFFNPNISGTPQLSELTFWISINHTTPNN